MATGTFPVCITHSIPLLNRSSTAKETPSRFVSLHVSSYRYPSDLTHICHVNIKSHKYTRNLFEAKDNV